MKTLGFISWGAALLLASAITVSYAQSGSGTAPEHKGNTGWTGGSRDQPSQNGPDAGSQSTAIGTTGQGSRNSDPEAAANQPLMATGVDLKGPPRRFPANQTPE